MVSIENDLDVILEKIEQLSVADLFTVQEHLTKQIREKTVGASNSQAKAAPEVSANGNGQVVAGEKESDEDDEPDVIHLYPGSSIIRYTSKGAKKLLSTMFTAEELEAATNFDPNTLPKIARSIAEDVSEARQERFL